MLLASESVLPTSSTAVFTHKESESVATSAELSLDQCKIFRCNGSVSAFESAKISIAMSTIAVTDVQGVAPARVRELVNQLTANVVSALLRCQTTRQDVPYRKRSGSGRAIDDKGCFGSLCCKGFSHAAVRCVGGVVVV